MSDSAFCMRRGCNAAATCGDYCNNHLPSPVSPAQEAGQYCEHLDCWEWVERGRYCGKHSPAPARKDMPLYAGCLAYFPDALLAVSRLSKFGNDKHNPGEPLHWAKDKSADHADCIARHLLQHGTIDPESGLSHTVAVAWRALALLQTEIENART